MSWVDLNTNAHSKAEATQVVTGRSGGFNVNYGTGANGDGPPRWVYIAAAAAAVVLVVLVRKR